MALDGDADGEMSSLDIYLFLEQLLGHCYSDVQLEQASASALVK